MCSRSYKITMLRLMLRIVSLTTMLPTLDLAGSKKQHGGSGSGPGCVVHAQLLKQQKSGRLSDDPAKTKSVVFMPPRRLMISYFLCRYPAMSVVCVNSREPGNTGIVTPQAKESASVFFDAFIRAACVGMLSGIGNSPSSKPIL